MSVDGTKRLGYGGSATIDGTQILVTSGSFDQANNVATLDMLDLPSILDGSGLKRSRVYHAPGTAVFSGNLSFDVSEYATDTVIKTNALLDRNWEFDVGIHDGENSYVMTDCLAQSVSLSGAPGGLISCSVSFMGISEKMVDTVTNEYILDYGADPKNQPAAYWWSGGEDIRDWTFSFSQDVSPVYGNTSDVVPKYLRAGLIQYSLLITTYSELVYNIIKVMTETFTLTGFTSGKGYSFGGPTDLGMYSHTLETASASDASDGIVIT
jgi:hypothetical protein